MVTKLEKNRFEDIYRIYEEAFPQEERRSREAQRALFDHPCFQMLGEERDGELMAFLSYWRLPSCLFLEHLATAPAYRGQGTGRTLLEACLGIGVRPVFLEIEPVTAGDPMTGRRAGFYERLGFAVNRFPYLQMPLKEGDKPIPLWLLSYGSPVTEAEFEPYKREIYRIVYGVGR